jgi:hypothetical protein
MRKLTTILAAAAAPAALAAVLLGTAGQASAATTAGAPAAVTVAAVTPAHARVVIAHTYRAGVPDTTSVAGPGTVDSPNGPQWAADDLEATFTATPVAGQPGVWDVKVYSAGVYHAFANPRTGVAWKATGPMGGWIDYQVTSPNIPGARNLPATSPGTVTTSSLIGELFGGQAQITGGGHYWFGYDLHGGPLYLQQG